MKLAIVLSAFVLYTPLASSSVAAAMPQPATAEHQSSRATRTARAVDITTQYDGQALFIRDRWEVKIARDGDRFIYSGGESGKRGISLANGQLTKFGDKHLYKWNNAGTIYRVTWQPTDPNFARVQVFDAKGSELFNKLMWTPPEN